MVMQIKNSSESKVQMPAGKTRYKNCRKGFPMWLPKMEEGWSQVLMAENIFWAAWWPSWPSRYDQARKWWSSARRVSTFLAISAETS
jgi:hypothetical protein